MTSFREWIGQGLELLGQRVAGEPESATEETPPPPDHDSWYTDVDDYRTTQAGVRVSPASAQRLTVANACRRILSNTFAMLPARVFQRLGGRRKRVAPEHPLDRILHRRPNEYQTPFEFKLELADSLAARGNFLAEIRSGRDAFVQELWPIHPDHVWVDWYDRKSGRRRVYDVSAAHDGKARVLMGDRMWHPRLLSLNGGLSGASPIRMNAEGIGFALASQIYASRFFTNGARLAGFISPETDIERKQAQALEKTLGEKYGGSATRSHGLPVFKRRMHFDKVSISPKDAQLLELLNFSVAGTARIWGIPLWLLQHEEKDTAWGTGMETMGRGLNIYTMSPYVVSFEESAEFYLLQDDGYFVEMNVDALMRADLKARFLAYAEAVNANNPWLTRNQIREIESMDPDPSPEGDQYLVPVNNMGASRRRDAEKPLLYDHLDRPLSPELDHAA